MSERDETQPVLDTETVMPLDFRNNPNMPINLQWRDRWERESRPDFVGPPDLRNPYWYNSKTNTWTTDYERGIITQDSEQKVINEYNRRTGQNSHS